MQTKIFVALLFFMNLGYCVYAQDCNTNAYKEAVIKKIPEFFVFSKSYALTKQDSEHEIFFNKQKAYIVLADSYRTKIEIYRDENGKKVLLKSDRAYVSYVAPITGKCFIRFVFEETDEFCGAAVIAFLR